MPCSIRGRGRFQKGFQTHCLLCSQGSWLEGISASQETSVLFNKVSAHQPVCLMLTQMHFPTWDGPKASQRRGHRDGVGMPVCGVFRGVKLLFVFFCLYRINSVTSLLPLSQDPAHLGTEDLNTSEQGYTLTVPRAPLILQTFSM